MIFCYILSKRFWRYYPFFAKSLIYRTIYNLISTIMNRLTTSTIGNVLMFIISDKDVIGGTSVVKFS